MVDLLTPTSQSQNGPLWSRARLLAEITSISCRPSRQLLVTGDPGMGKTTLIETAVPELLAAGFTVLRASPSFAERYTSYSTLWDLLSTLDCASLSGGPERYRSFLEIAAGRRQPSAEVLPLATALSLEEVLAEVAAAGPVAIVVDDVQWADPESLVIVERAFRRSTSLPVHLVVAERTSRVSATTALDLNFPPADTHLLGGLSVDELEQAVRADWPSTLTKAQVVALHDHTGGNPLWAFELIARGVVGELGALPIGTVGAPLSLASAVAERLRDLSDDAADVVAIIALLGRPRLGLLASVLRFAGIPERASEEAEAAGFVSLTTESASTGHPLQASAATARLTPARRRELHRFIANEVVDPVVRAQHLQQSQPPGPHEPIAMALTHASDVMRSEGARLRSAHFAAQAVDRSNPSGEHHQDRLLTQAQQLFSAGDLVTCLRVLSRVRTTELDLHQYDSLIALQTSALASHRGHDAVIDFLHRQTSDSATDPQRLAVVQANYVADDLLAVAERAHLATTALATLSGADAPNSIHRALKGCIRAQLDGGGGLNRELIEDSTRRQGEQIVAGLDDTGLATTGFYAHLIDDVARSRIALAELTEWARGEGKEGVERVFAAHAAHAEITGGNLVAARRLAVASTLSASSAHLPGSVMPMIGLLLVADGRYDELEEMVADCGGSESGTGLFAALVAPALLGLSALARGDWSRAVDHLRGAAHRADDLQLVELGSRFQIDLPLVEALLMNGETTEATTRLAAVRVFLSTRERPISRIGLHRLTSMELAAGNDLGGALLEAELTIELALDAARPADEALGRLQRARVLMRLRKVTLSRQEVDVALVQALASGDAAVIQQARTASESTRQGKSSTHLTRAEQRVLAVVVRGQTNREIAAELFLSPRTVESHVAAILRKTGAASRSKLRSVS